MTGSLSALPGLPQYQAKSQLKYCTDHKPHCAHGHSEPDMQNPWGRLERTFYNDLVLENSETRAPEI